MTKLLWQPNHIKQQNSQMTLFSDFISSKFDCVFSTYNEFWKWSVTYKEKFWQEFLHFSNIKLKNEGNIVFRQEKQFYRCQYFVDYTINYAQNILENNLHGEVALIFRSENGDKEKWDWDLLRERVATLSHYLHQQGIKKGDRIVAYLPNIPYTVVFFLACASLGAIWVSCSPDFGVQGVLDRFLQVQPKVFVCCGEYFYNGKNINLIDKIQAITHKIPSLQLKIIVPYSGQETVIMPEFQNIENIYKSQNEVNLQYEALPFNHPLYILFSSGTTGVPKCIVHSSGGALLQHVKEHRLHCDIQPQEKIFFYTTCGWMMWNWLVTALASQATLCLFDGSPTFQNPDLLFNFAEEEAIHFMGIGSKLIDFYRNEKRHPQKTHNLYSLKTIATTGSPLSPECFNFVYENIKKDVHLTSISGGTDIVSCFMLGNPNLPVYSGEIQCAGLGMDIDIFDKHALPTQQQGELVCKTPFPSQPIYFWNDNDYEKYHHAYFSQNNNIWYHGDFVSKTDQGGYIIHGRSDTLLNPGGVRIGTAEIYRFVDQLAEIEESVVIGQDWRNDIRIILFVKLNKYSILDNTLKEKIRAVLRDNASPKHIPAKIFAVQEIPRTRSGKLAEMAVKKIINGENINNVETLANYQSLEHYRELKILCEE